VVDVIISTIVSVAGEDFVQGVDVRRVCRKWYSSGLGRLCISCVLVSLCVIEKINANAYRTSSTGNGADVGVGDGDDGEEF
jgi:hypothetical protein